MKEVTLVPAQSYATVCGIAKVTYWKGLVTVHYANGARKSARMNVPFNADNLPEIVCLVEDAERVTT